MVEETSERPLVQGKRLGSVKSSSETRAMAAASSSSARIAFAQTTSHGSSRCSRKTTSFSAGWAGGFPVAIASSRDRKSTRLNSSHSSISYAVFCLKKKIHDDPDVRVVFFKTSLNTGWDCPRAEVMMSFRAATDSTYIAQLVGDRKITRLNSSHAYI